MKKVKDTYIHVRVDEETKLLAEQLAESLGINISQLIRLLLKQNSLLYILENANRITIKEINQKAR